MSYKSDRTAEDIKRELTVLVRELKDPRIAPMLSGVKVQVSNDLSYAKVYVSAVEGMDRTKESVQGLKSASGFIRRELSGRLHLRKCPELSFVADDSIAYGAQINRMLEQLHTKTPEEPAGDEEMD